MTHKIKCLLVLVLVLFSISTALLWVTQQSRDSLPSDLSDGRSLEASDVRVVTDEDRGAKAKRRRDLIETPENLPPKLALLDGELGLIRLSPDELAKILSHFPEVERVENPDIESSPEEGRFSQQLLGVFSRDQLLEILPSINLGSASVSDTGSVSLGGRILDASATRRSVSGELIDIEVTLEERIEGNASNEIIRSKGVVTSRKGWVLLLRSSGQNPAGLLLVAGADI